MINEQTCDTLKKRKLTAMADELLNQFKNKIAYNKVHPKMKKLKSAMHREMQRVVSSNP